MSSFNIILGTAVFGKGDPIPGGLCDVNAIKNIIDTFCEYGYKELDTSRVYCKGTSEEILAEIEATNKCKVSTKVAPFPPGTFQPDRLKATFYESLKTLRLDKVDILYLHAPDHTVPIRATLRAIQDLYEEGRFARFGLSNFASWQVSAVWEIMNERGWVKPTVYQGMYNALLRDAERELFPCLRRYNIRFYAHTILACGLLGHDYKGVDIHRTDNQEDAYSFGSSTWQSALYPGKYWNQYFFKSVANVHDVASKAGISPSDIAIRWLVYHSNLKPEFNDAIIIGATAVEHVRNNSKAVGQGPLPDSIVKALDRAWKAAMFQGPSYFV